MKNNGHKILLIIFRIITIFDYIMSFRFIYNNNLKIAVIYLWLGSVMSWLTFINSKNLKDNVSKK